MSNTVPFIYEIENTSPMRYQHSHLTYPQFKGKFKEQSDLIEEITYAYNVGDSIGDLARKFENRTGWRLIGIEKKELKSNECFKSIKMKDLMDIMRG